jgi:hypothetical protein
MLRANAHGADENRRPSNCCRKSSGAIVVWLKSKNGRSISNNITAHLLSRHSFASRRYSSTVLLKANLPLQSTKGQRTKAAPSCASPANAHSPPRGRNGRPSFWERPSPRAARPERSLPRGVTSVSQGELTVSISSQASQWPLAAFGPAMASHVGFRLSAEHMRPSSRLMSMGRLATLQKNEAPREPDVQL